MLLHLALGNRESYENWLGFLRDLLRRGLRVPVMVTTDGAPGLVRAVEEVFAQSLRQRCLAHKVRNVTDKIPESARMSEFERQQLAPLRQELGLAPIEPAQASQVA